MPSYYCKLQNYSKVGTKLEKKQQTDQSCLFVGLFPNLQCLAYGTQPASVLSEPLNNIFRMDTDKSDHFLDRSI